MQLGMVGSVGWRTWSDPRQEQHTFGEKLLSAMRRQFGGHAEARAEPKE